MKKLFLALTLNLLIITVYAQKFTISGYVEDAGSGEHLIGASVYNPDNLTQGTMTNNYGYYSLTIPSGQVKINASFIGYQSLQVDFKLTKDTLINFKLSLQNEIEKVIVSGERNIVESSQMSTVEIPIKAVMKLPVLLGETDVLKTVQLMPGVQSGSEGTSGIYVRGGGPDQNLILLDGVPVYNANHLFGFFSVFNGYAVNDITLIKGGFPARYGGRLSSVLDIRMKEGNMKKYKGEISTGLIATKFSFEGPVVKDKTSFIISGRRTYIDILTAPIIAVASKASSGEKFVAGYYFYDFNAKINHKFSDNDRLYLSFYTGRDKAYANVEDSYSDWDSNDYYYKDEFDLHWGNITSALRWNHLYTPKLFSNLTATFSDYTFSTEMYDLYEYTIEEPDGFKKYTDEYSISYKSGIQDFTLKYDFDYLPNPNHKIKYGISGTYRIFRPGVSAFQYTEEQSDTDIRINWGNKNLDAQEAVAYIEDDLKIGTRFKMNIGGHFSFFNVKDTFYYSAQPRIAIRYLISDNISAKASYAHMTQYLHFLTNSSIGLPTDLWLPATDRVPPEKSVQYAAGLAFKLPGDLDLTLEGFYKTMSNLIEYKEGASFFDDPETSEEERVGWEDKIEQGEGWAYGGELLLQKKIGNFSGWIGYTLSWTNRQFENISFGKVFPYRYDRRHDISIALMYKFNDHIDMGATWVYGTGIAVTLAQQQYLPFHYVQSKIDELSGSESYDTWWNPTEYYGTRNNFRLPAYHRLDVGINFTKEKKRGMRTWNISLYNAYNRLNAFYVDFEYRYTAQGTSTRELMKYSLFPLIPSFTYSYKFN